MRTLLFLILLAPSLWAQEINVAPMAVAKAAAAASVPAFVSVADTGYTDGGYGKVTFSLPFTVGETSGTGLVAFLDLMNNTTPLYPDSIKWGTQKFAYVDTLKHGAGNRIWGCYKLLSATAGSGNVVVYDHGSVPGDEVMIITLSVLEYSNLDDVVFVVDTASSPGSTQEVRSPAFASSTSELTLSGCSMLSQTIDSCSTVNGQVQRGNKRASGSGRPSIMVSEKTGTASVYHAYYQHDGYDPNIIAVRLVAP